jgi:hypothetical protein
LSTATSPPTGAHQFPAAEPCPLCSAPLAADQEWCLRCGAAARTRMAATPNWKAPVATLAVIAALALGIIAAALVKLAGDSGPAPTPATTTVTTSATTGALLGTSTPTTTVPATTLPQTTTTTGAISTDTTAPTGTGTTAGAGAGGTAAP